MDQVKFTNSKSFAENLDEEDDLKYIKARFYTKEGQIYLDGNSLGLLSRDAEHSLFRALKEWKDLAIRGWYEAKTPWFYMAEKIGAKCAALVGAKEEEVVFTGTTTGNIHSLISTFYNPTPEKNKILADEIDFPTDIYALRSQMALRGFDPQNDLILVPSKDGMNLEENKIIEMMQDDIALVFLPSVLYKSGQLLDIKTLTQAAHERGILIGFDCSHSVGVVPHYFDEWEVDFATWCSYKYLNGGPGANAFLYVNKKHFEIPPALTGWFGNKKDEIFDFKLSFNHDHSAGGWQLSAPSIIGSATLDGSLNIIREAGIENIRKKSILLTEYLIFMIKEELIKYDFSLGSLEEVNRRGGHIALEHNKAEKICDELIKQGVIIDYRPPRTIRIAPSPLYNTFIDIWNTVQIIKSIIQNLL